MATALAVTQTKRKRRAPSNRSFEAEIMKNLLALLCAFTLCGLPAQAADAPKLNLLYITADDMNADSPGWMGSKMGATPVLDALAPTCHRFINNHVTAPICQP